MFINARAEVNINENQIENGGSPATPSFIIPARVLMKLTLLLLIVGLCLSEFVLQRQSWIFREIEVALHQTRWLPLVCFAAWCCVTICMTSDLKDSLIIGLLALIIPAYWVTQQENELAKNSAPLLFVVILAACLT